MDKPTIQKILQQHKDELFEELKLPYFQVKALKKLSICRTAELGGHAEYCENGHLDGVWYNSCRHRSCPQCNGLSRERGLARKITASAMSCGVPMRRAGSIASRRSLMPGAW